MHVEHRGCRLSHLLLKNFVSTVGLPWHGVGIWPRTLRRRQLLQVVLRLPGAGLKLGAASLISSIISLLQ